MGARGGLVAKTLRYKPAGRGFEKKKKFLMVSLEFFIDITFPVALSPWGRHSL